MHMFCQPVSMGLRAIGPSLTSIDIFGLAGIGLQRGINAALVRFAALPPACLLAFCDTAYQLGCSLFSGLSILPATAGLFAAIIPYHALARMQAFG